MTDFNKLNTIDDIRRHFTDVSGPTLVHFFNHSEVAGEVGKAREVASFLEKINLVAKKTLPDEALLRKIKEEKANGTVAYRVISSRQGDDGDYVETAIRKLEALKTKFGVYSDLDRDLFFLKEALKDDPTKLAELKKFEDRFLPINEEIKKLNQSEAAYDRTIQSIRNGLDKYNEELIEINNRIETTRTDGTLDKYEAYKLKVADWNRLIINDATKTNRYDFQFTGSSVTHSVIGAELRTNLLFFFVKQYIAKLKPEDVDDYLGTRGSRELWDNIMEMTDEDVTCPYPIINSGEKQDELENKYYFRVEYPDKDANGKKRRLWDFTQKAAKENKPFRYTSIFALMEKWFPAAETLDANYKAFTDENDNPFRKAGLLTKNHEVLYATIGKTINPGTYEPDANSKWYDNGPKREPLNIDGLQSAAKAFNEIFSPENKRQFLGTSVLANWQLLTGLSTVPENFVNDGNDTVFQQIMESVELEDPLKILTKQKERKEEQIRIGKLSLERQFTKKAEELDFLAEFAKLESLKTDLETFKKTVTDKLLQKGRGYYEKTNNGSDLKVLTRKEFFFIFHFFSQVAESGNLNASDKVILNSVKALHEQLVAKSNVFVEYWSTIKGHNFKEKLANFPDADFAHQLYNEWDSVKELITFEAEDLTVHTELKKIIDRLANGEKWEDVKGKSEKLPDISKSDVQNLFVNLVNDKAKPSDEIAETWTKHNVPNSKLATIIEIQAWIEENITGKKKEFLAHLDAKLPKDKKPLGDTEDEKIANFLNSTKALEVVRLVVTHQLESPDHRKTITDKMKEKSSSGKPLDMSKYGGGTVEKPNEEGIIKFAIEDTVAKTHEYIGSEKKEGNPDKPWWQRYGCMAIWLPILLITIGVVAFYWTNIMNWWNGSVEEGTDESEEK